MTLRILEFNDAGLRVSDESGILLSSPGYALVTPQHIEFGENARRQSRINPLNCFNQFWHRLSLDPFSRQIAHYRHNADIAFSHLQDLTQTADLSGDVLLAVPASFSRQQLAILLGLIKQSALRTVGVVDAGLVATIDQSDDERLIHVDIQLHQVVLSRLQRHGKELARESVALVPGTGWVNLSESLMQLLTTAFIQQSRFNPQHNAESEQMLLDGLPGWLREDVSADSERNSDDEDAEDSRRSLLVKLDHNNNIHQARLPRSSLRHRLQPFYQKILQQLEGLDPQGNSSLLLSDRMSLLPGFAAVIASEQARTLRGLDEDAVSRACLRYHEALTSTPEAVHYITRLRPAAPVSGSHVDVVGTEKLSPTHLLLAYQADRLADGLQISMGLDGDGRHTLALTDKDSPDTPELLGEILHEDGHYYLSRTKGLSVNGQLVRGMKRLRLGDRIGHAQAMDTIDLIRVRDKHG
jgi:hypothetical protein